MTTSTTEGFGPLLRILRQRASLSQEALAEKAGLSADAVASLERGRRHAPRLETVGLLADALGLDQSDRTRLIAAARPESGAALQSVAKFAPPAGPMLPALPVPLTPLIGRAAELAFAADLLLAEPPAEPARVLTLIGPGGVGKTRLALAVAARVEGAYPDGVCLLELAALADPALVAGTLATILGLQEEHGRDNVDALRTYLRAKRMLLVLDNCEHLIGACADVAAALLRTCPGLQILATSREGLDVTGERRYPVPTLTVPDPAQLPPPEELAGYPAVALFVARVQERRPDFALTAHNAAAVAQVCARLDGIPLAIELAAARAQALSVESIAARMDDRFRLLTGGPRTVQPRQQTLLAALYWSYDLLPDGERTLLRRLSVFAGGWTLEAAEVVGADTDIQSIEVLDLLGQLLNKSLVYTDEREGEIRYGLLETVRQFARDRLQEVGGTASVADRHLEHYLDLAEEAAQLLTGPAQRVWLARLDSEHDNLRAALRWALEGADPGRHTKGMRLAGALWRFWYTRGYLSEGRAWLERTLGAPETTDPAARAQALYGAGVLAISQGDLATAGIRCEESLALYQQLGNTGGAAVALNVLGSIAKEKGDLQRAAALSEESLALQRMVGDARGIAVALNNLGSVLQEAGDLERTEDLYAESLSLNRRLDDVRGVAFALHNLGEVLRLRHSYLRAADLCAESLTLMRDLGDTLGTAATLHILGDIARDQGDHSHAAALYQESLALYRALENVAGTALLEKRLSQLAASSG